MQRQYQYDYRYSYSYSCYLGPAECLRLMFKIHELPWLPVAPERFNERCAGLYDCVDLVKEVRELAACALTLNQSNRLVRSIANIEGAQTELRQTYTDFKLGLVSNAMVELILPGLTAAALRHGIHLDITCGDFGQVAQEAFDPDSRLNRAGLDAVLIALDYRGYPFGRNSLANTIEGTVAADGLVFLNQIREAFHSNSGTLCIVQSLATPPLSLIGNMDAQLDEMLCKEIAEFNRELIQSTKSSSDILLDVAKLASSVGTHYWFDERQWYLSRIPMANVFVPLYCEHVVRLVAALRGKSKKCLVLDLDNTLWSGVIGDDGLDRIHIGQGDPVGESHLAIQQFAFELKKFGVILAVCSKNEESIALQPFREHPDMLLKEDDFAVFIANWDDKATNIRRIAKDLNIGLDSIVFVDDNPFEREVVRNLVSEVAVPELPDDAALIPRTLSAAGYFEMISFTQEDAERNSQYAANVKRDSVLQEYTDISEFLSSLDMTILFSPFDSVGRKRITQLINKTNQFNLTTRRYTENEIRKFELSSDVYTMQARLTDRFGDNGMVSVIICRKLNNVWEIDTWLMSCRVINRGVEEIACDELFKAAREMGIQSIRGIYRPTKKNKLVRDHYQNLGFNKIESYAKEHVWEMAVEVYQPKQPSIKVLSNFEYV